MAARLRRRHVDVDRLLPHPRRGYSGRVRQARQDGTVTDRDVRHLAWLRRSLGDGLLDAVVLTTGPAAYRRPDGIAVVPLALPHQQARLAALHAFAARAGTSAVIMTP